MALAIRAALLLIPLAGGALAAAGLAAGPLGVAAALGGLALLLALAVARGEVRAAAALGAEPLADAGLNALAADLARRLGGPAPRLLVAPLDQPNALALRGPGSRGTVVLTAGLLRTLHGPELAALLARETARLRSPDAPVAATLTGLAGLLPPLGGVLRLALPRGRVLAEDRRGALLHGDPRALALALARLAGAAGAVPNPAAEARPMLAAAFVVSPRSGRRGPGFGPRPAVQARIAALEDLALALEASIRREARADPAFAPAPGPWGTRPLGQALGA